MPIARQCKRRADVIVLVCAVGCASRGNIAQGEGIILGNLQKLGNRRLEVSIRLPVEALRLHGCNLDSTFSLRLADVILRQLSIQGRVLVAQVSEKVGRRGQGQWELRGDAMQLVPKAIIAAVEVAGEPCRRSCRNVVCL